jgi:hypothetical protein
MTNKEISEKVMKAASAAHLNLTPTDLVQHALNNGRYW